MKKVSDTHIKSNSDGATVFVPRSSIVSVGRVDGQYVMTTASGNVYDIHAVEYWALRDKECQVEQDGNVYYAKF